MAMGGALPVRRQLAGFAAALVLLPTLALVLSAFRSETSLTSDALAFQLLVVVVAMIGGLWLLAFLIVFMGPKIRF